MPPAAQRLAATIFDFSLGNSQSKRHVANESVKATMEAKTANTPKSAGLNKRDNKGMARIGRIIAKILLRAT